MVAVESRSPVVAATAPDASGELREIVDLAVAALSPGPSMRERGISPAHVAALAEVPERWPPIVVNRADGSVVDGQHRVAAAAQLGIRTLRAVWFDGSPDDGYLEFVRRNVAHGLPLTLAERRVAARRILGSRPELSDRGIAAACALSPRTVARLREEADASAHRVDDSAGRRTTARIGRDGRVRPVDPRATRARIARELTDRPDASLRAIARVVGASPETVRSVRNEMRVATAEPPEDRRRDAEATVLGLLSRRGPVATRVGDDPAFADRDEGHGFAGWFDATAVEAADLCQYVDAVPLSRIYEIADEARRRGEFWNRFAGALEGRVRRRA